MNFAKLMLCFVLIGLLNATRLQGAESDELVEAKQKLKDLKIETKSLNDCFSRTAKQFNQIAKIRNIVSKLKNIPAKDRSTSIGIKKLTTDFKALFASVRKEYERSDVEAPEGAGADNISAMREHVSLLYIKLLNALESGVMTTINAYEAINNFGVDTVVETPVAPENEAEPVEDEKPEVTEEEPEVTEGEPEGVNT